MERGGAGGEREEGGLTMTQEECVILMLGATDERDWDARCDKVKAAHGGDYPAYWYEAVNKSGLMSLVFPNFKRTS